jgi:undecaprenyl-diphosphatase
LYQTLLSKINSIRFLERVVLLTLLLIAGSIWAFVEIAGNVLGGDTQAFDESILQMLRQPSDLSSPIGPRWLWEVARDITALGGVAVIALITIAALGFLWMQRKRHAMLLVLASVVGGLLLSMLLKEGFARERPSLVPHLTKVSTLSFPSGHSMLSTVTYLTLGTLLARTSRGWGPKLYFISLAALLALIIGLSRIYLGVHYPTDVLAGWCAGIAWALLCGTIARWLQQRGAVEQDKPEEAAGAAG